MSRRDGEMTCKFDAPAAVRDDSQVVQRAVSRRSSSAHNPFAHLDQGPASHAARPFKASPRPVPVSDTIIHGTCDLPPCAVFTHAMDAMRAPLHHCLCRNCSRQLSINIPSEPARSLRPVKRRSYNERSA